MLTYCLFPTTLGRCGIAWSDDLVVATHLPALNDALTFDEFAARLARRRPDARQGAPPPAIEQAIVAITALMRGEKADLRFVDCDFAGVDPFAVRVYPATRAIPPGDTMTYGAVAAQLGDRRLAQSVGHALGRNPVPMIVPCHRVIGANGKLTGFSASGGVQTKLKMLAIKGAAIGEAPGLFGHLPLATKPDA